MENEIISEAVRKCRQPANFRWREEAEKWRKAALFWKGVAILAVFFSAVLLFLVIL